MGATTTRTGVELRARRLVATPGDVVGVRRLRHRSAEDVNPDALRALGVPPTG